ncbi:phage/plasmid primase, P4 family [Ancylobacter mangrovi]|uniref:phage/plasmid primase, P4 family n=1 Tax=Ancylobacter mangrovi TaxID=2972472 RepID=UPI0021626C72|nr:phage/plasmid primase, P4 family [Ancylobacter mangrovi]MCS0501392.1 phage/plasmid primase, P4 family [Ancylobacter mangrovi]
MSEIDPTIARRIASIVEPEETGASAPPASPADTDPRQGSEAPAEAPRDGFQEDPPRERPGPEDDNPYDDGPDGPADGEPPFDGDDGPPPGFAPEDPALIACAGEPQNDIGNGRRLRHRHGADLLFVPNLGWHRWDGTRWFRAEDDEDDVRALAHATAEAINLEAFVMAPTPKEAEAMEAAQEAALRLEEIPHEINELDDLEMSKREKGRRKFQLTRERDAARVVVARGMAAEKAWATRKSQRRRFAVSSGNAGKLDGMLGEARPYLVRALRDLDPDPIAFNVLNGTIRFHAVEDPECPDPDVVRRKWTFSILPQERGDFITKLAPVFHCPEAGAPVFHAFLERILPDPEVRAYVQRFFGYCLTALTTEQMFCIFFGEGSNGKSTLVDIIAHIMGDYATSVPVMSLVNENTRKGSEATPDLIRLPAARFVRSAEPKEGLPLDESLIKELTGGEPINVRRLNHEFLEVYPQFKLAISCNRKPVIRGNDDGIWRRVSLVPFEVQIPKEDRDKRLPAKLKAEMSGILNWMIEGALAYLDRGGLEPPEAVMSATKEYRDESDPIGAFVRTAIEVTRMPHDVVEQGRLYEAFAIYCKREGKTPLQGSTFARRMPKAAHDYGFEKGKSSLSVYVGIRLRPDYEPHDPSRTPYG